MDMCAMSVFVISLVSLFGALQASVMPEDFDEALQASVMPEDFDEALQASVMPEDFDETILLQRKFTTGSLRVIPPFGGSVELTQDNMAEQLAAIQELLDDPDDSGGSDGDGNGGGADLDSVKQMLEEQMEAYLLALHTAAQSEWQTASGAFSSCGTHRERRFDIATGDVVLVAQAMNQARVKHQACRQSEKAWNTYRGLDIATPADLAVHEVDADASAFIDAATSAQMLAQAYNDLVPVGKHECLVDQTVFEWAICTWEAKAREACNAYTTCTTAVGLTDLQNQLRVDAAERRALWRTIQILKCRIDELANGAAGTDDGDGQYADPCLNMTVTTHHLMLNLPDPQPNDCADEQLPPLTGPSMEDTAQCAVWMSMEYNWAPSEAVVPTACAATCLGVHPPQPPHGCVDTNTQCDFYRLHPSACGSFAAEGQSIQACSDCCYCQYAPGCGNCPPGYIVHQGGTACLECPDGQVPNADSTQCVDPEPCVASVDCSGHGTTTDLDKSDGCDCECLEGWLGASCSTPPPCDAAFHCNGNGATVDTDSTNGCDCACDDGFEGDDCGTATSGGSLQPGAPFFDPDMTSCTSSHSTRRIVACDSPSAPAGWVLLAEYQDDECIRDIPDYPTQSAGGWSGMTEWQQGWYTQNAQFLGSNALSALMSTESYTKGSICFKASRTQCNGGCFEFDTSHIDSASWDDFSSQGGPCHEYGLSSQLERLLMWLAGACSIGRDRAPSFLRTLAFEGADGKSMLGCTNGEQMLYPGSYWPYHGGWSWHWMGWGVTLKNSNGDGTHNLGVGDELVSMRHGSQCPWSSSDVDSNVDSMWLYMGTADAASVTA